MDNGLCTKIEECRYLMPKLVCNKVIHPLSVRVKQDLFKYGKALAWFLGNEKVLVEHIRVIAPYMIWHRSQLSKKYKDDYFREKIGIS